MLDLGRTFFSSWDALATYTKKSLDDFDKFMKNPYLFEGLKSRFFQNSADEFQLDTTNIRQSLLKISESVRASTKGSEGTIMEGVTMFKIREGMSASDWKHLLLFLILLELNKDVIIENLKRRSRFRKIYGHLTGTPTSISDIKYILGLRNEINRTFPETYDENGEELEPKITGLSSYRPLSERDVDSNSIKQNPRNILSFPINTEAERENLYTYLRVTKWILKMLDTQKKFIEVNSIPGQCYGCRVPAKDNYIISCSCNITPTLEEIEPKETTDLRSRIDPCDAETTQDCGQCTRKYRKTKGRVRCRVLCKSTRKRCLRHARRGNGGENLGECWSHRNTREIEGGRMTYLDQKRDQGFIDSKKVWKELFLLCERLTDGYRSFIGKNADEIVETYVQTKGIITREDISRQMTGSI